MLFTPHPYQSRAIAFVKEHTHCMLLLDMGLGKSVITLTALSGLIDELELSRVLVVAPKSVAEATWSAEVSKWDHLRYLRVSTVIGDARKRRRALEADADIYVISRDNLVWLVKEKKQLRFDALVLDELTSFKNHSAQRFKAVRLIRGRFSRIIGLTGTPAPNGYLDLWAQVYCIDGGARLGVSITRYRERYFTVVNPYATWYGYTLAPGSQATINEKIADIALSMSAADYLTLPDCIRIPVPVLLSDTLQAQYNKFEREQVLQLTQGMITTETGAPAILAANAAALVAKLIQFANGAIYDEEHYVHAIHDAKIQALLDIIEAAQSPVLVFYAFKHDAARISEAIPEARTYTGPDDLEAWNAGRIPVLLAHPASTAYGLNMQQGGHTIVWFGLTWNLEHYQQANARLHRQGQTQPVRIYHLIAKDTIDERIYRGLEVKARTQNALLDAVKSLVDKYQ